MTREGLPNIGNTCFVNASLQALFASSTFTNWLDTDDDSDSPLKTKLISLDMATKNKSLFIKDQYIKFYEECKCLSI
jgi:ubiquitin C-terminal hydrolase